MARLWPVSSLRSQQRRIALHAAGRVHDLALPAEDALGQALIAMGLLPRDQERVVDPGGRPIDLDTRASELREGGLYCIVTPAGGFAADPRRAPDAEKAALLPWVLLALALLTLAVAVIGGQESSGPRGTTWAAVLIGCALLALVGWGRGEEHARHVWVPLVVAGGASVAILGGMGATAAPLAAAAGFAIVATGGAFLGLIAAPLTTRAVGAPIAVISGAIAVLLFAGSILGWSLDHCVVVAGAASCVGLRALPYLLVKVDDGHHIDYGRFMIVRWTVRGRVPMYRPTVEAEAIRRRVQATEARLQTSMIYLSALAGIGMWAAALQLSSESRLERITAAVVIVLSALGMVLVSRKTTASILKRPLRVGAGAGLAGAAAIGTSQWAAMTGTTALLIAGAMLFAGVVTATIAPAIARGARSIGWSRLGDMLEAVAIAFVLPAAIVSVGTIDFLRGVFS